MWGRPWRRRAALAAFSVLGTLATLLGDARAQEVVVGTDPAFNVDPMVAAPGAGAFLQVEDAAVLPDRAQAFGVVANAISRPLVVYALDDLEHVAAGEMLTEPVAFRAGIDVLGAIGLGDRYQVGLAVPLVLYQAGDRLRGLDFPDNARNQPLAASALGDLRLSGKVRLVAPPYGHGLAAAADVIVTLPTGDDQHFAGEAGVVGEARLIASFRAPRWAAAVNVGPRIRTEEVQFLDPSFTLGNEISLGAAAEVTVPRTRERLTALAEVVSAFRDRAEDPTEVRAGVRWRLNRALTVAAAAGFGVGDAGAVGAPAWRAVLDMRYQPRSDLDTDHDGWVDGDDPCPRQAEDLDGHEDRDGCVDPDNDGDGMADEADACPDGAEDVDGFRDTDGCPDLDNDSDGIVDGADRCPRDEEDRDGFADGDGCPDRDDDGDGLRDPQDACPREAEDQDGWKDEDGCPESDNDGDGVPDAGDRCPVELEDPDGWLDEDGCLDGDDDRDGIPDALDRCVDLPETITGPSDTEMDGCPDGEPLAKVEMAREPGVARGGAPAKTAGGRHGRTSGGTHGEPSAEASEGAPQVKIVFSAAAQRLSAWKRGTAELTPAGAVLVDAIAAAARRAGWDVARPALRVTVFDERGRWSNLAAERTRVVVERLGRAGVAAEVAAGTEGRGFKVVATPEAVRAGRRVEVRGTP